MGFLFNSKPNVKREPEFYQYRFSENLTPLPKKDQYILCLCMLV